MKALLGKKVGMSRIFHEDGSSSPVTLVECGPCPVIQVKTPEKDGYAALQIGYGDVKEKSCTKARVQHCKKAGVEPVRYLRELRLDEKPSVNAGEKLTAGVFNEVRFVDVQGISKGRGFAGTIKRHNFSRGKETHGNTNHRAPGSIGNHSYPARVFPGKKMPGHYGAAKSTVRNLAVIRVDEESNLLVVRGSIPGPNNAIVFVREAVGKND